MKFTRSIVGAAVAAFALALPALAAAHPGIYALTPNTATNEVQRIVVTGTGGTFAPAGITNIPFDASTTLVANTIIGDLGLAANTVAVTSTVAGTYVITYQRGEGAKPQPDLATSNALTGPAAGAAFSTTSNGVALGSGAERYAIGNDGFSAAIVKSNGDTTVGVGAAGDGIINYQKFPSALRAGLSSIEKMNTTAPGAQTSIQAHATCTGGATLNAYLTDAKLVQWQGADPFFHYLPWQSASAGLGDVASSWINQIKTDLGVDLTGKSVAEATALCTGIGGTYKAADTVTVNDAEGRAEAVDAAVAPKDTIIGTLNGQVAALTALKNGADAAKVVAEAKVVTLEGQVRASAQQVAALTDRKLTVELAAKKFGTSGGVALVTGTSGDKVSVSYTVTKAVAKSLGLKSTTLDASSVKIGAEGAELATFTPPAAIAKAIGKKSGTVKVTVVAKVGAESASVAGTLVR